MIHRLLHQLWRIQGGDIKWNPMDPRRRIYKCWESIRNQSYRCCAHTFSSEVFPRQLGSKVLFCVPRPQRRQVLGPNNILLWRLRWWLGAPMMEPSTAWDKRKNERGKERVEKNERKRETEEKKRRKKEKRKKKVPRRTGTRGRRRGRSECRRSRTAAALPQVGGGKDGKQGRREID